MRALSNAELVDLWEVGTDLHPLDRALLTLSAAFPEVPQDDLADWPLGRRNHALTEWRCLRFGPILRGWTLCPSCGETLEFEIDHRDLLSDPTSCKPSESPVVVNGQRFRLPTSRDLARIAHEVSPEVASVRLLEACRLDTDPHPEWTAEEIDAVGNELAQADPMAETLIGLRCDSCGSDWQEALEIAPFLWKEVECRAKRLLSEVHALASNYGWTEREILSIGDRRRAFYLQAVRA